MRGQLILSLVMLMTYIVHFSFAVVMEGKCPRLAAVHVTEEMFSGRWFELLRSRADVKYNEIPTTCTVEEFSFTTYKSSSENIKTFNFSVAYLIAFLKLFYNGRF